MSTYAKPGRQTFALTLMLGTSLCIANSTRTPEVDIGALPLTVTPTVGHPHGADATVRQLLHHYRGKTYPGTEADSEAFHRIASGTEAGTEAGSGAPTEAAVQSTGASNSRIHHFFEEGVGKARDHLSHVADAMQSNVEAVGEAADKTQATMGKYDEHVHKVARELDRVDAILDKLAILRTKQFGEYEGKRMGSFAAINPKITDTNEVEKESQNPGGDSRSATAAAATAAAATEQESRSNSHGGDSNSASAAAATEQESRSNSQGGDSRSASAAATEQESRSSSHGADSRSASAAATRQESRPDSSMIQMVSGSSEPDSDADSEETPAGSSAESDHQETPAGSSPGSDDADGPGASSLTHLNKEGLIAEASNLVPESDRAKADEMYEGLPSGDGEMHMKEFKQSMEATHRLDDTGKTLAHNAAKATEALVGAHKKMQEWHAVVKNNIKDLDKFEGAVDQLSTAALKELKEKNSDRLESFDKVVGSSDVHD